MKQKFRMFSFVRVDDSLPYYMSHFENGFEAIVRGTYSQLYGGNDIKEYSVYRLCNGKVVDCISWYPEEALSRSLEQDRNKAEDMVEEYNLKND